jgi:hypothetical protein
MKLIGKYHGTSSVLIKLSIFMQVFYKERLNGYYGVAVYTLSNFLSSFPYLTVMSFGTSSITYYMVKFRSEFSNFLYVFMALLSSIATVESCMMTIASLVPNYLMGFVIGSGYIVRQYSNSSFSAHHHSS